MEALLKALKDSKTVFESAGEKIKGLLARINYFKIGKDLLFKGAPYAIGAITGNPLPIAVNLSADLLTSTNISEKLQNFSDQYIKSADSESITENIRKFRDEFEKMLADVKSIDNLVVIIDDLDRCSPDRIIDTLEAIKLFLSVKKTTFIVAVDQRIIEYAVRTKYPQIEGFDISSDYIEKIIQLPIKIPELSSKDIENYLLLLICQLQLKKASFQTLQSPEQLSTVDINRLIKELVCQFAKHKFAQLFDKQIRNKFPNVEEANIRITEMQEYIYYTMELKLTPEILSTINPESLANEPVIQETMTKGFEFLEEFYGE